MNYENKAYIPQSPEQLKREYLETPFWFMKFGPGSQITIVEDLPRNKPLRFMMKPSQKGGPAFATNLIKITDGFVTKDLEISKTNAQLLFVNLPDSVHNLKGCVFANDNGRWIFVMQKDNSYDENLPKKSAEIARSMEPATAQPDIPKQLNDYAEMLGNAVKMDNTLGRKVDIQMLTKMADSICPNRALDVIAAAKTKGCIVDHGAEGYRGY